MDSVKRFVDEGCAREFDALTRAGELFDAYREWCFHNGVERVGLQEFAPALEALGIYKVQRANGNYYEHIRVLTDEEVAAEDDD